MYDLLETITTQGRPLGSQYPERLDPQPASANGTATRNGKTQACGAKPGQLTHVISAANAGFRNCCSQRVAPRSIKFGSAWLATTVRLIRARVRTSKKDTRWRVRHATTPGGATIGSESIGGSCRPRVCDVMTRRKMQDARQPHGRDGLCFVDASRRVTPGGYIGNWSATPMTWSAVIGHHNAP